MPKTKVKTQDNKTNRNDAIEKQWRRWGKDKYFDEILKDPDKVKKHLLFMVRNYDWDWYNVARCLDLHPDYTVVRTIKDWKSKVEEEAEKIGLAEVGFTIREPKKAYSKTCFLPGDKKDKKAIRWVAVQTKTMKDGQSKRAVVPYYNVSSVQCELEENLLTNGANRWFNKLYQTVEEIKNKKNSSIETAFTVFYDSKDWLSLLSLQVVQSLADERLLKRKENETFFVGCTKYLLESTLNPQRNFSFNLSWSWERGEGFSSVGAYMLLEDIVRELPIYLKTIYKEACYDIQQRKHQELRLRLESISINDRKAQAAQRRKARISKNGGAEDNLSEDKEYSNSFEAKGMGDME